MIDIIIVTYNNENTINNCLKSIDKYAKNVNVKIFDNASTDNTYQIIQKFKPKNIKKLSTFKNITNIGFGKACNFYGLNTFSNYLIFMNPDLELVDNENNIFDLIRKTIRNEVRALGVTHQDYNNRIRTQGVIGNPITHIDRHLCKNLTDNNCLYVSGGFLAIKRLDFQLLVGFDDRYFLYYEDFDLCLKLHNFYKQNCRIVNIDDYIVKHKFQGSEINMEKRMEYIRASESKFIDKWKYTNIKVGDFSE